MNIVIDLDGTLINSAPDVQHVASTILSGLRKGIHCSPATWEGCIILNSYIKATNS